jgi:gliding motility-associated-like protein
LDTATLLPSIGDTLNLPDCRQSCCILFSREFVFKDDEAPQLINPPDDAVYSCVDAIPMMPDLQYNDNCSTGGIVSGEEIGLADIIDTGTFFRIWSISDRCNNLTTYQQRISIPDIEAFELTLNPPFAEVTPGEVISVEVNTSLDPNEIAGLEWRPSVGLSCVDCLVTEITAQEDQTYTLRLTDTAGCSREIVFELLFREPDIEIFIPNTFSPNGDGLNDGFTLFSNGNFTNVSLVIFDRWGTLIYSSENIIPNDESSGWDGTVNGEDVVTGVYLYSFTLNYEDGHREVLTGDLTIIR